MPDAPRIKNAKPPNIVKTIDAHIVSGIGIPLNLVQFQAGGLTIGDSGIAAKNAIRTSTKVSQYYIPIGTGIDNSIGDSAYQIDSLNRILAPSGGEILCDTYRLFGGSTVARLSSSVLSVGNLDYPTQIFGESLSYGLYFNTSRFIISDADLGFKFLTTGSSSGEAWNVENASSELVARFRTTSGTAPDDFTGLKLAYGMAYQQEKIRMTPEGGYAVRLTNKTGGASVKGSVVESSNTTDNAFRLSVSNSNFPIGVVYESGIADGSECWMVQFGRAQVLMEDSTAVARDGTEYLNASATAGRAMVSTSVAVAQHNREIGHPLEANAGGTDQLIWAILHYN